MATMSYLEKGQIEDIAKEVYEKFEKEALKEDFKILKEFRK